MAVAGIVGAVCQSWVVFLLALGAGNNLAQAASVARAKPNPLTQPKIPQPALADTAGVQAAALKAANFLGCNFQGKPLIFENGVFKWAEVQVSGGQPPRCLLEGGKFNIKPLRKGAILLLIPPHRLA